ncbi:DUF637 domain-containing protein [Pseudomonas sp. UBA2684]|uniref:DUF637 domain-containing protein n=1 Tax=Pseudomonas sp. UBA2684 TaxID=1947311 RepID=UPI0030D9AAC5|tara:strand:+ start:24345 stop:26660 length:2316 start_codon:yes stop_codon:yes gene_type:complete
MDVRSPFFQNIATVLIGILFLNPIVTATAELAASSAGRSIALSAAGDVVLASAANEDHFYAKSKKVTRQQDRIDQQASEIRAGGDVLIGADHNLALIASQVEAGGEAYLVAGEQLALLSAEDYDYSLYEKKSKGSWGRKSFKRDETTQVTNVGSQITTGGDLTLLSGGDQTYQAAKLDSGADLTLESGGAIAFEAVKDLEQESHEKSKNSWAWNSMSGKGHTDETVVQSQLIAQGELAIKAAEGLQIDIKQIDQKSVSQTIDAMVQADPQLAWLKQAEQRGDVDWRRVQEVHESFKYSHSSLGPAAQLIIAIALSMVMGPVMMGMNSVGQAVTVSVATNATVSTINNRGDLGAVVKDVTSSDAIKGYVVAAATAGVGDSLGYKPTELGFNAESIKTVAVKTVADSLIETAVYGGSFKDNLADAAVGNAVSIGGALGANEIGNQFTNSSLPKIAMHAALGGLLAEAMGGDFRTGALAVGANEALVELLGDKLLPAGKDQNSPEYKQGAKNLLAASQIIGVLAAVVAEGDAEAGAAVAANATANNYLLHREETAAAVDQVMERCQLSPACTEQFSKLDSQEVMNAFEVIAAKDGKALAEINPDARLFAAQMLDEDVSLAGRIFIPETGTEKALDAAKTTAEWAGTLAGLGGAAVAVKSGIKAFAGVFARSSVKEIDNSVIGKPRVGSANKLPDGQHGFNNIIDNYAGDAAKFEIPTKGAGGKVVRVSELRQIEGSNNGVDGVFEWIIDQGDVTHRRFIPDGKVTGLPNQIPKK